MHAHKKGMAIKNALVVPSIAATFWHDMELVRILSGWPGGGEARDHHVAQTLSGIDLKRASRNIDKSGGAWFSATRGKGRIFRGKYPIPKLILLTCGPQFWLERYISMAKYF